MSTLDVPGARLYFETHGDGPLLLLIPGAAGTAEVFRAVLERLQDDYRVAIYDRRGFSRSQLTGSQDYANRLATDADDGQQLLAHLGGEPAAVVGTSSGAVVALELMTRHPASVRTLVPFEPCAMKLIADGSAWLEFFATAYEQYRREGIWPALEAFRTRTFAPGDGVAMARAMDPEKGPSVIANATYWFERESREYPAAELDLDALADVAERVIPVVGADSAGYPCSDVAIELGRRLGREVREVPGGHLAYFTEAAAFAEGIRRWIGKW